MLPENDPGSPAQKPGWKTSEFWLSLLTVLVGALLGAGVFPVESPVVRALGVVASILSGLGYQGSRSWVKASGNKAAAFVEVAKSNPSAPPQ